MRAMAGKGGREQAFVIEEPSMVVNMAVWADIRVMRGGRDAA